MPEEPLGPRHGEVLGGLLGAEQHSRGRLSDVWLAPVRSRGGHGALLSLPSVRIHFDVGRMPLWGPTSHLPPPWGPPSHPAPLWDALFGRAPVKVMSASLAFPGQTRGPHSVLALLIGSPRKYAAGLASNPS